MGAYERYPGLQAIMARAPRSTLVLSHADVLQLLQSVGFDAFMDAMIAHLHDTLRTVTDDAITVVTRGGFSFDGPSLGLVEWMPILVHPSAVIVKTIGYHPRNRPRHRLPTIVGSIALYDGHTGCLRAVADATLMTAVRTGAASAVASRLLACPDARCLGVIGCGSQAVTQLHALSRVYPFERVVAYDVDGDVAASLSARTATLGLRVEAVDRAVVEREADIICTATSSHPGAPPVFEAAHVKPWLHVNAVGSDSVGKTELPQAFLDDSLVCPDFLAQALVEGECQHVRPERIGPDLIALAQAPDRYREWRMRKTVFDSTGFALEDAVGLDLLLAHAVERGLGRETPIDAIDGSALDPYAVYATGAVAEAPALS